MRATEMIRGLDEASRIIAESEEHHKAAQKAAITRHLNKGRVCDFDEICELFTTLEDTDPYKWELHRELIDWMIRRKIRDNRILKKIGYRFGQLRKRAKKLVDHKGQPLKGYFQAYPLKKRARKTALEMAEEKEADGIADLFNTIFAGNPNIKEI